ncbi:Rhodanese-like protein [Amylostereum chailletii]|nr:Rhodanese-like protein [Amylostereum chailletii]
MSSKVPLLLSPAQLHELRSTTDVSILDASWHMPNSPRNAKQEFLSRRIPGARYLDLDEVASPNSLGLRHMMPSGPTFAHALDHRYSYDSVGIFSSPRALFMLKSFGHDKSSVLDGGLPSWEVHGLPIESGPVGESPRGNYPIPTMQSDSVRSYEQMVSNAKDELISNVDAELVLDARSRGRYLGVDPEPRPGLSSGHIPKSFSLPFNAFLQSHAVPNSDKTYTTYLPPDELKRALVDAVGEEHAKQILDGKRSVTASCGSGMTAGVLYLGLKLIAESSRVAIYDESWTGYASRPESEIVKSTS